MIKGGAAAIERRVRVPLRRRTCAVMSVIAATYAAGADARAQRFDFVRRKRGISFRKSGGHPRRGLPGTPARRVEDSATVSRVGEAWRRNSAKAVSQRHRLSTAMTL
jgi:hypothetical protein